MTEYNFTPKGDDGLQTMQVAQFVKAYHEAQTSFFNWLLPPNSTSRDYTCRELQEHFKVQIATKPINNDTIIGLQQAIEIRTKVDEFFETRAPEAESTATHAFFTNCLRLWLNNLSTRRRPAFKTEADYDVAIPVSTDGSLPLPSADVTYASLHLMRLSSLIDRARKTWLAFQSGDIHMSEMAIDLDGVMLEAKATILEASMNSAVVSALQELLSNVGGFEAKIVEPNTALHRTPHIIEIKPPNGRSWLVPAHCKKLRKPYAMITSFAQALSEITVCTGLDDVFIRLGYKISISNLRSFSDSTDTLRTFAGQGNVDAEKATLRDIERTDEALRSWKGPLSAWLLGSVINRHFAFVEGYGIAYLLTESSTPSRGNTFTRTLFLLDHTEREKFPGLAHAFSRMAERSHVASIYDSMWPVYAARGSQEPNKIFSQYDNLGTFQAWILEAAALVACCPLDSDRNSSKPHAFLPDFDLLQSDLLEVGRVYRAPILRFHRGTSIEIFNSRNVDLEAGLSWHLQNTAYNLQMAQIRHLELSNIYTKDVLQTVFVLKNESGDTVTCSMGGDFCTADAGLWPYQPVSNAHGAFKKRTEKFLRLLPCNGLDGHVREAKLYSASFTVPKAKILDQSFVIIRGHGARLSDSQWMPRPRKSADAPIYSIPPQWLFWSVISSRYSFLIGHEVESLLPHRHSNVRPIPRFGRADSLWINIPEAFDAMKYTGLVPQPSDAVKELLGLGGNRCRSGRIGALQQTVQDGLEVQLMMYALRALIRTWRHIQRSAFEDALLATTAFFSSDYLTTNVQLSYILAARAQALLFINPKHARNALSKAQKLYTVKEHEVLRIIADSLAESSVLPKLPADVEDWPIVIELKKKYGEWEN